MEIIADEDGEDIKVEEGKVDIKVEEVYGSSYYPED